MKNLKKPVWIFVFSGVVVGLILALHGKSGVPLSSEYPLLELEAQKAVLQGFVNEQQRLEASLVTLRKQVEEAQDKLSQSQKTFEKQRLDALKEKSGLASLKGAGISIFLADSVQIDRENVTPNADTLVHAPDLRDLLNLLFSSGASAVAVNGQRILPLSSVNFVGNTFLINDFHVFPPFNIQALGSQEVLGARLRDVAFLPSVQKRASVGKIRFFWQERDEMEIPAFEGTLNTNHMTVLP